eukprot:819020-Ditylum_brightwellii.AAC.1
MDCRKSSMSLSHCCFGFGHFIPCSLKSLLRCEYAVYGPAEVVCETLYAAIIHVHLLHHSSKAVHLHLPNLLLSVP